MPHLNQARREGSRNVRSVSTDGDAIRSETRQLATTAPPATGQNSIDVAPPLITSCSSWVNPTASIAPSLPDHPAFSLSVANTRNDLRRLVEAT